MYPVRKRLRLASFSYGAGHWYFITICVAERQPLLSRVSAGTSIPTTLGTVVEESWWDLPRHHAGAQLDLLVLMPDHLHGILALNEDHGTSLSVVIGGFKAATTRQLRRLGWWNARPIWQRGFYDRVIRNEGELRRIREYVLQNPQRWNR